MPETYPAFLTELKQRISTARLRASLAVNKELVLLYWNIGHEILTRQQDEGWGAKVTDRLAADLRRAFPEMTGFSERNLRYMRTFAAAWPDAPIGQQAAAQLPLGAHHGAAGRGSEFEREARLVRTPNHRKRPEPQRPRPSDRKPPLRTRQGGALMNFERTLPEAQSDLAQQLIEDPYSFDFLSLAPPGTWSVRSRRDCSSKSSRSS